MIKHGIALVAATALSASPGGAAELLNDAPTGTPRSAAVAGAYFRLSLGGPAGPERAPAAGLRLAISHDIGSPHAFAVSRQANLLDLRFREAGGTALFVAGRPISGAQADRINAAGESKGRLDKIMIGTGIALGAVAAFFLVSSVS
jgi:hypothetical protein